MTQLISAENQATSVFKIAPEFISIFNETQCPETAKVAEVIFNRKGYSLKDLNSILQSSISDYTQYESLSSEFKTSRYAHALLRIYYTIDLQSSVQRYDEMHYSLMSQGFSFLTSQLSGLASYILTPSEPIDCQKNPQRQQQEEYVLCEGFKSFLAERKLHNISSTVSQQCVGISPIAHRYTNNFGTYWAAAHNKEVDYSFHANNVRDRWSTQINPQSCSSDSCKKSDSNLSVASFSDWMGKIYPLIQNKIPNAWNNEFLEAHTQSTSLNEER